MIDWENIKDYNWKDLIEVEPTIPAVRKEVQDILHYLMEAWKENNLQIEYLFWGKPTWRIFMRYPRVEDTDKYGGMVYYSWIIR